MLKASLKKQLRLLMCGKQYRCESQPCYAAVKITSQRRQPYAATSLINRKQPSSACCLASFCVLCVALAFSTAHTSRPPSLLFHIMRNIGYKHTAFTIALGDCNQKAGDCTAEILNRTVASTQVYCQSRVCNASGSKISVNYM